MPARRPGEPRPAQPTTHNAVLAAYSLVVKQVWGPEYLHALRTAMHESKPAGYDSIWQHRGVRYVAPHRVNPNDFAFYLYDTAVRDRSHRVLFRAVAREGLSSGTGMYLHTVVTYLTRHRQVCLRTRGDKQCCGPAPNTSVCLECLPPCPHCAAQPIRAAQHSAVCPHCNQTYAPCRGRHDCGPGITAVRDMDRRLATRPAPHDTYPRLCGVELELVHCPAVPQLEQYGIGVGTDGSIRAGAETPMPAYSRELRFPPIAGNDVPEVLGNTIAALRDSGAIVNDSTGLHVHVDVRGSTARMRQNVAVIWANLEAIILRLTVPARRHDGRFCRVWGAGRSEAANPFSVAAHHDRYLTLNYRDAYQSHGTLEFRLWEGTLDPAVVLGLVEVSQQIIQWGLTERAPTRLRYDKDPPNTWELFLKRLTKATADMLVAGRLMSGAVSTPVQPVTRGV